MVWPVFSLLLLASGLSSAEPAGDPAGVRVRASTEPAGQVVIGEQTRFFVEIMTERWFAEAPRYPELALEGAVALMPEQLGTNFTERIEGQTFAGQRRSYVIFPQRAGPLVIPSLRIPLAISREGAEPQHVEVHTPVLRLQVVLPAEAEGVADLITTPRLTVRDTWSGALDELRVGDAVQRTVSMQADRALGMLLPVLSFEAPAGIAVYADQPRVEDSINRGQYRGERVERVTYVLQRAGDFTLPAIELPWWNPERGVLEREVLEGRSFAVSASSAADLVPALPTGRGLGWRSWLGRAADYAAAHRRALLLAVLAGLGAFWGLRRALPALRLWVLSEWERRRESEARYFRQLERSLRRGDRDAVVGDYWRWRSRIDEAVGGEHAERELAAATSGFAAVWARFEEGRYGVPSGSTAIPTDLQRALRSLRRTLLASGFPVARPANFHGLNPRRAKPRASPAG